MLVCPSVCPSVRPHATTRPPNIRIFMKFDFYVWVSVHHKLIYVKKTNVLQLGSMFISNCNNTLHVSDAFLRPSSGALINCSNSLWCMTWDGVKYPIRASKVDGFRSAEAIDLGPWTLDLGPWTNKQTANLHHFGFLYIWNLIFEDSSKICRENSGVIKIGQE